MKTLIIPFIALAATLASCDKDNPTVDPVDPTPVVTTTNPHAAITDPAKVQMLTTLTDPFKGTQLENRVIEMNYSLDYKLDDAVNYGMTVTSDMLGFLSTYLYDQTPDTKASFNYDAGCSAFACRDKSDSSVFYMGRNFDYLHRTASGSDDITAIVVKTPGSAKDSTYATISVVDSYWLNGLKKGFYTDNSTDISLLMAAPFFPMDGINEKGLAMSVLKLDGQPTVQNDPDKATVNTSVAIRYILDHCATIDQAVNWLKTVNMNMDSKLIVCSMHFFIADASGQSAVIEYISDDPRTVNPSEMKVTYLSQTTNFYVGLDTPENPNPSGYGWASDHGKARYNDIVNGLTANNYSLALNEAFGLLKTVSQGPDAGYDTSNTQWSSVYDLTNRTLNIAFLRDYANILHYQF